VIAAVSVPWALAPIAAYLLGRGIPRREAPEVGRVYFVVPVEVGHDVIDYDDHEDFIVRYFWTREEAERWGEADIERRLGGDEE
jgi:hypothetical protein